MGEEADLAIVVGGDGNMLGAARVLARFDVAVLGVNRGNLGFLTDLTPQDFTDPLSQVLQGRFQTEYRFLLEASVHRHRPDLAPPVTEQKQWLFDSGHEVGRLAP